MRPGHGALVFRMELHPDEPGMLIEFDDLYQVILVIQPHRFKTGIAVKGQVFVVELEAVTVTFGDVLLIVD